MTTCFQCYISWPHWSWALQNDQQQCCIIVNCWTHLTCWNDVGDVEAALILEPVLWDQGEISKERTFKFCSRSFWYLYWQVDKCACVCFCTTVFLLLITLSQFYFNPTFEFLTFTFVLIFGIEQSFFVSFRWCCSRGWIECMLKCYRFAKYWEQQEKTNFCKILLQNTGSNNRKTTFCNVRHSYTAYTPTFATTTTTATKERKYKNEICMI